ncbi:MAG: cytochrome c3 family protein, partial [Candidatus Nitrospinota bacterium M3_3B_026]
MMRLFRKPLVQAAILAVAAAALLKPSAVRADGWASNTKASNTGSIVNTRHNMTMSYLLDNGGNPAFMDPSRNDYGAICVYCHTPHGANTQIDAPLWNRTSPGNTYTLYNIPLTSGQSPTQPGVNSLTCLSCHDGTVAIDSIINMPGSGRYSAAQENSVNTGFLDSWPGAAGTHRALIGDSGNSSSCLYCHSSGGFIPSIPFDVFALGTDLTDDHPVGVELPDTNTYDFNAPTATDGSLKFFDLDADGRADSNEVRFYDSGG